MLAGLASCDPPVPGPRRGGGFAGGEDGEVAVQPVALGSALHDEFGTGVDLERFWQGGGPDGRCS